MRCVLPHTQRCHESKACTSPATALYFSQNKQPQRQQRRRGGAVHAVNARRTCTSTTPLPAPRSVHEGRQRGEVVQIPVIHSSRLRPWQQATTAGKTLMSQMTQVLKTDDDSHARTTWFDVDDASETAERHDILGSFWGRPALGLWRQAALELATGTPGRRAAARGP